jgi:hypothetical protein
MRARIWVSLAVGLVGLTIPVSPAAAQDEPCAMGPRQDIFFFAGTPGGNGRLAQTFITQPGGAVTTAQADVAKFGTSADWIMQINEVDGSGTPTNTVLASTTIPDSAVPAGDSIITGTFANPAPVSAGQRYALVVTRPGSTGLGVGLRTSGDCPGRFFTSFSQTDPFNGQSQDMIFAVSVTVLPEPVGPVDSTLPDATITKGPKDKTKQKTATFEFIGSDARAVAGFECSLDGEAFRACSSPITYKVRKGKHTFQVQAIDTAGNVGPPATDTWTVKKKRRR